MPINDELIKNANHVAQILKVLGHPERLLVLCYLSEREHSAGELVEKSNLSFSAFSQHLAVLRKAELVQSRRSAQTIYYSVKDKAILDVLHVLKNNYCNNLY